VGEHPQAGPARIDHELYRLARVVRDRHRLDAKAVDLEGATRIDEPMLAVGRARHPRHRLPGAVRQVDGYAVAAGKAEHAADMVTVLMGDEDAGERLGRHVERLQSATRLPQAESAVDQHAGATAGSVRRLDHEGIALAAAAETRKAHVPVLFPGPRAAAVPG